MILRERKRNDESSAGYVTLGKIRTDKGKKMYLLPDQYCPQSKLTSLCYSSINQWKCNATGVTAKHKKRKGEGEKKLKRKEKTT